MAKKLILLIGVLVILVVVNSIFILSLIKKEESSPSLKLIESENPQNPTSEETREKELPPIDLNKASTIALFHIGKGEVTDAELTENYYEIEITLNNKDKISVILDRNFKILSN